MSLDIRLSMNAQNLAPFRAAWEAASRDGDHLSQDSLSELAQYDLAEVPDALRPHIALVGQIAALLSDPLWHTDAHTRRGLNGALLYFDKADDLIPDNDPRFGLLDDAIVLELALADHSHEWQAWREYRTYCNAHPELGDISRDRWIALRQQAQVRRRGHNRYTHPSYAQPNSSSRYSLLAPLPRLDLC